MTTVPTLEPVPEVKLSTEIDVQLATLDSCTLSDSEEIRAMTITDGVTYEAAVSRGRLVATFIAEVEEVRERLTKPLYVPLQRIRSAFKSVLDVAEADKRYLSGLCGRWDHDQLVLKQQADRIAREEHERQEREAKIAAAVKAEDSGLSKTAVNAILSSPIATMPAAAPPAKPKPSGVSARVYWNLYPAASNPPEELEAAHIATGDPEKDLELGAFLRLVRAAAIAPDRYIHLLQLNESAARSEADVKKTLCRIPGYEARGESRASFRKG